MKRASTANNKVINACPWVPILQQWRTTLMTVLRKHLWLRKLEKGAVLANSLLATNCFSSVNWNVMVSCGNSVWLHRKTVSIVSSFVYIWLLGNSTAGKISIYNVNAMHSIVGALMVLLSRTFIITHLLPTYSKLPASSQANVELYRCAFNFTG